MSRTVGDAAKPFLIAPTTGDDLCHKSYPRLRETTRLALFGGSGRNALNCTLTSSVGRQIGGPLAQRMS